MNEFHLVSDFPPQGDQPKAIDQLSQGVFDNHRYQTLLGVTGSGKTFTIANVIQHVQRPTLVIAHNKTLAAQLCQEFRQFFPQNAVEYFVSFYDYYQPEAYLPQTDTYIEKDSSINDEIDRMRHSATQAVSHRRDVIVVASVSCIYGLGSPDEYSRTVIKIQTGQTLDRQKFLSQLVELQFTRNDLSLTRATFRARGDVVEIFPADEEMITRLDLFGDQVDSIALIHPVTGDILKKLDETMIFPATHYVASPSTLERAVKAIEEELEERLSYFHQEGKLLEAQRLEQRTHYDLEMLREIGYCTGIENYSRHLDGRNPGQPPFTLLDYFPKDFLLVIDESHQTLPQLHAMYGGDRSRKDNLVIHGFRLPCAYDNRPLTFEEFEQRLSQVIFTSATPGPYESEKSSQVIQQIIRPTGLVDPVILVRRSEGQIDDLIHEIRIRIERQQRTLVTTLTKRMAEDLTDYLLDLGIKVHYLHSDIQTLERTEILRDLRLGKYDVVVGINLLREGLDLPEVTLVAILDADKEGFLRSETSLIQTIGRAARNVDGTVIMYADHITGGMKRALSETERRRQLQVSFNQQHDITPASIQKTVPETGFLSQAAETRVEYRVEVLDLQLEEIPVRIAQLEQEMKKAARQLEFEEAAELRDEIARLRKRLNF